MSFSEVWADEIASPRSRGGFVRYRPGRISFSPQGKILEISRISASKLRLHSKKKKVQREKTIIPGLVDCHTHLVFAGDRADEWNQRLKGATYQDIAKKGGGIQSTVRQTRAASESELLRRSRVRLEQMLALGVTTVEIKTGYGLSLGAELKLLSVIRQLKRTQKQTILSTFMGAHARPAEFATHSEYVDFLIEELLPKVKGLADFQDAFCERGYFDVKDSIRLLRAGKKIGLRPKVHAHEFGRTGGVKAAAVVHATSADHLMHMNDEDISLLRKSGVVPVVLPGTCFFLGARTFSPARKMLDRGLPVAIASDFNPGTNPSLNLPLCGTLAAVHQGLNLEEVLAGQTLNAAKALALNDRGTLEVGKRADFVALDAQSFEGMYYNYGRSVVNSVFIGGKKAF